MLADIAHDLTSHEIYRQRVCYRQWYNNNIAILHLSHVPVQKFIKTHLCQTMLIKRVITSEWLMGSLIT